MPKIENLTLTNQAGLTLAARLDYPAAKPRGWAIFAHCFTCSKDVLAAARVAQGLAMEGIGVLRLDFTGLGQSEGEFGDTSFTSNIEDIATAATWLEENHGAPGLLIGHSLGGAAVLAAASGLPSVKGVATIGAPADPQHVQHLFEDHLDDIAKDGTAQVSIGGRPITVGKTFVDDLMTHDAKTTIATLNIDILVLHSPTDQIVGIENAAAIYSAAKHPKSFVSLDRADHLLTKREDSAFAAKVIAAWAARSLGEGQQADAADDGAVMVQSSPESILAHDISVGVHRMRADEGEDFPGGRDSGPAPYDFLKAGLGACTAITIRMVAERKKWPLEGCKVVIRHRAEGEGEAKQDFFTRELILEGPLDDDQRAFLKGIANKCPVHRTLEKASSVDTVLKD
jgi:putative redox protein